MNLSNSLMTGLCACLCLGVATVAVAQTNIPDELGGHMRAVVDGHPVIFPTLKTDIDADIQGDLATVTVVQTFANPLQEALHATYLFPLNKDAAVYEMTMEVGNERVRAEIQRVEEARRTYEVAKKAGKSAALLTQHRPNMFTQDIANLMPGVPIKVTLTYVQTVPKVDGEYQLVVPLVVGPRFQPDGTGVEPVAQAQVDQPDPPQQQAGGDVPRWDLADPPGPAGGATLADSTEQFGQWEVEQLPAYPPVSGMELPQHIDAQRVSLQIRIDSGMPIANVLSQTHTIRTEQPSAQTRLIALADGRTIDNRDFVLRYALAGTTNQAGLLAYRDDHGGFFSLLIEPPASPDEDQIGRREMVFVLDCSGSMSGLPMDASKAFMREALRNLRPTDTFRIVRFSDTATEFSSRPLIATPANVRRGIAYSDQLYGSGGTMMTSGIEQALQVAPTEDTLRLVVFLTDGYIGNDFEVLRLLEENLGAARLFALGVGTGVNRYLLSEMGRIGRGFTRYMDPTEHTEAVAKELTDRLQTPVLTDIRIDWGGLVSTGLTPTLIPDLFAGQSLRLQGRYSIAGEYRIKIHGKVNGRPATLPFQVNLPEQSTHGEAVKLVWARSAIKDAMHLMLAPEELRPDQETDTRLKQRITQLGLDYALVTQWTAFVAVSEKVYNADPDATGTRPVPLAQVKGITENAYGGSYTGYATPEPQTIFGLLLVAGMLGWFVARRRVSSPVSEAGDEPITC